MTIRRISPCCQSRTRPNVRDGGFFCTKCGSDCKPKEEATGFSKRSTLNTVRRPTGETEVFQEVWGRCKGKSEVSGVDLLPYGHPMWHAQFSHLLPKGSYQNDRLEAVNIVACTVEEHTEEWPLVKEHTDEEIKGLGMEKWIPKVTLFRALRLKYNQRLAAELSGRA